MTDLVKTQKTQSKIIYPFINELVDVLYTSQIHELVDSKCHTDEDRRVFMMYLLTYFYTYMQIPSEMKTDDIKIELKKFLSDIIKNPDKRKVCIDLFLHFENTINCLGITD